jgi:hypothetical protein
MVGQVSFKGPPGYVGVVYATLKVPKPTGHFVFLVGVFYQGHWPSTCVFRTPPLPTNAVDPSATPLPSDPDLPGWTWFSCPADTGAEGGHIVALERTGTLQYQVSLHNPSPTNRQLLTTIVASMHI